VGFPATAKRSGGRSVTPWQTERLRSEMSGAEGLSALVLCERLSGANEAEREGCHKRSKDGAE